MTAPERPRKLAPSAGSSSGQRIKLSRELMLRLSEALRARDQLCSSTCRPPPAATQVAAAPGQQVQPARPLQLHVQSYQTQQQRLLSASQDSLQPISKLPLQDLNSEEQQQQQQQQEKSAHSELSSQQVEEATSGRTGGARTGKPKRRRRRATCRRASDQSNKLSSARAAPFGAAAAAAGAPTVISPPPPNRHRKQRKSRTRSQSATSEPRPATCDIGRPPRSSWRSRAALLWAALLIALALSFASASPQLSPTTPTRLSDVELSRAVLATMSTEASPSAADASSSPSASTSPAELNQTTSVLDRLLDFGRIFVMGAIIVGDICGNSLVILSVCRHSRLRVTTNWFVVSLACADILVALFAMTFNASVIISGRWLFSQWVCDFWNSCDVLASTASILHLCCISIDRYIAITRPLDYPMKITTRRVMYALCGVWISSALLSYIPIFTGVYTTAEHINWLQENPDQCDFVVNRVYAIVSSSISFWIPSSIMVFTYYRIYKEATRQEKFIYKAQSMIPAPVVKPPSAANHAHAHGGKQRRSKSVAVASLGSHSGGGGGGGGNTDSKIRHLARQQYELAPRPPAAITKSDVPAVTLSGPGGESSERAASLLALEAAGVEPAERDPLALDLNNNNSNSNNNSISTAGAKPPTSTAATVSFQEEPDDDQDSNSGQSTPTKRSISKMKREHKAAKTLGIIMGVFILCWLPFFSWYTPQHICGHACDGIVPRSAVTILFWIGYFNSTLNPIIYAYFNHEFRDAFKKTLQWIFCCCKDLKCLRVNRPNDNQHYNCTYRSTQEIGLVSNS